MLGFIFFYVKRISQIPCSEAPFEPNLGVGMNSILAPPPDSLCVRVRKNAGFGSTSIENSE